MRLPRISDDGEARQELIEEIKTDLGLDDMPQVRVMVGNGKGATPGEDISLELVTHDDMFVETSVFLFLSDGTPCASTTEQMARLRKHGIDMSNQPRFATTRLGRGYRNDWDLWSNIIEDATQHGLTTPLEKNTGVCRADLETFVDWFISTDTDLEGISSRLMFADPFDATREEAITNMLYTRVDADGATMSDLIDAVNQYENRDITSGTLGDRLSRILERYDIDYEDGIDYLNEIGQEYRLALTINGDDA